MKVTFQAFEKDA